MTEEYFERGSMPKQKIVLAYQTFAREFCLVNGEFPDRNP